MNNEAPTLEQLANKLVAEMDFKIDEHSARMLLLACTLAINAQTVNLALQQRAESLADKIDAASIAHAINGVAQAIVQQVKHNAKISDAVMHPSIDIATRLMEERVTGYRGSA